MLRRSFITLSILVAASAAAQAPKPPMLVDTAWVAAHAKDPGVRLVDMRPGYGQGHIPGAVQIAEAGLQNRDDRDTYLPRPEAFAAMMGKAGIGSNTHVVIYDDQGGRQAARFWYVLNAYGHEKVSLVDGGWTRWTAEKRPASLDVPSIAPTTFTPKQTPALTCPSPEVLARKPGVVVLDTRSEGEHKLGRIPGSVNVDWRENVTGPNQQFKPADELRKLYAAKGITPDKEIVTHCASGGRASQTLFTLKMLGYPKVRIYYGSFTDYVGRPGAPVEK